MKMEVASSYKMMVTN